MLINARLQFCGGHLLAGVVAEYVTGTIGV